MELTREQENIINRYFEYNTQGRPARLEGMCNKVIKKLGYNNPSEMEEFYSIASEVILDLVQKYDSSKCKFETLFYNALMNRFKNFIRERNALKRQCEYQALSLDYKTDDEGSIGDTLSSGYSLENDVLELDKSDKLDRYFDTLSRKQRKVAQGLMEGNTPQDIMSDMNITQPEYNDLLAGLKQFDKISILF